MEVGTKTHRLKTWPEYFIPIVIGGKTFEFRKDDRDFKIGDHLLLREWDWQKKQYTGREVVALVTYKFTGFEGLAPGYCILGIKKLWEKLHEN